MRKQYTLEELLERGKRDPETGCLEFVGCLVDGYGMIFNAGRGRGVHRLAWQLAKGPIPDGFCVCHRCDNRRCFELEHLFLGTKADNNKDMTEKGRRARLERHGRAVLTEELALKIVSDPRSGRRLAAELGVSASAVHFVRSGRRWGEVTGIQRRGVAA